MLENSLLLDLRCAFTAYLKFLYKLCGILQRCNNCRNLHTYANTAYQSSDFICSSSWLVSGCSTNFHLLSHKANRQMLTWVNDHPTSFVQEAGRIFNIIPNQFLNSNKLLLILIAFIMCTEIRCWSLEWSMTTGRRPDISLGYQIPNVIYTSN